MELLKSSAINLGTGLTIGLLLSVGFVGYWTIKNDGKIPTRSSVMTQIIKAKI